MEVRSRPFAGIIRFRFLPLKGNGSVLSLERKAPRYVPYEATNCTRMEGLFPLSGRFFSTIRRYVRKGVLNSFLMKMILLTDPEPLEGEDELITAFFERGLSDLHLRKYEATEGQLLDFFRRIPPEYHSRIVLHHHHYLVRKFDLKGVHFNSYIKDIGNFPKGDLLFSRALHDPAFLGDVEPSVDRVLLSPVYPPISKTPEEGSLSRELLEQELKGKDFPFETVALGGIVPERIGELQGLGFDAFGVLGAIWETFRKEGKEAAMLRFEAFDEEVRQVL